MKSKCADRRHSLKRVSQVVDSKLGHISTIGALARAQYLLFSSYHREQQIMAHKFREAYSGKNPVPTVALRSIFDPSGATEAKAKHFVGAQTRAEKNDQDETESAMKQMLKGKSVSVNVRPPLSSFKNIPVTSLRQDPVTGDETVG